MSDKKGAGWRARRIVDLAHEIYKDIRVSTEGAQEGSCVAALVMGYIAVDVRENLTELCPCHKKAAVQCALDTFAGALSAQLAERKIPVAISILARK